MAVDMEQFGELTEAEKGAVAAAKVAGKEPAELVAKMRASTPVSAEDLQARFGELTEVEKGAVAAAEILGKDPAAILTKMRGQGR